MLGIASYGDGGREAKGIARIETDSPHEVAGSPGAPLQGPRHLPFTQRKHESRKPRFFLDFRPMPRQGLEPRTY